MKMGRIIVISVFILVLISTTACSLGQNNASQTQVAVTRGDLTVVVNGTGKAVYANDAKLAFGTAGKIEKLPVRKGETVTKGSLLAELDTGNLELALSQAQTVEAQARVALTTAQLNQTQMEASLTAAQFDLDRTKAVGEIKDAITNIEWTIKVAEESIKQALSTGNTTSINSLSQYIADNQRALAFQQKKLQDLLAKDQYAGIATYEIGGQKYDRLIVEDIRMKQQQVQIAQQSIEQVRQAIEQAKLSLQQATKAVMVTQKQLTDATLIAPFDGSVVTLDIKQGDFVAAPGSGSGTPIYMVDPRSLEINTEIDEIDVANVRIAQRAIMRLDALPNKQFEGIVNAISLTPVEKPQNSGVVVYEVKVGFVGTPPAEAKSGMSVSVDIVTQEKENVVLVPNKSVKRNSRGQTVVNVVSNEKIEERLVVLGSTDGVRTEIISGLDAGDMIIKLAKDSNSKPS